ncbi:MAG: EpsG family protein [Flavobacterium sp.]
MLLFFILFGVFVGVNFLEGPNSDMYRYVSRAAYYRDVTFVDIFLEKDFYYPLVSKLVTQVSTNFYFISVCFTTIYYFLFYKCIKVIADNVNPNYNTYLPWFYILALYTVLPFTVVTAFRFNSAVLFFCWCLLEYTLNNKRKFLYLILLTPFFHFSFLFYTALPFVYLAIKNLKKRLNIVLLIFGLSVVYSNSNLSGFVDNFSKTYLTESVSTQIDAYASEEGQENNTKRYAKAEKEGSAKRAINRGIITYSRQILMFSLVFFILRRRKFLTQHKFYEDLMIMALLSYSFTNFASSVLHGNRFFSVSNFYFYFVLFYLLTSVKVSMEQHKNFYYENKRLFHFISLVIVLNFLNLTYMVKIVFNFPNLIFGNWFTTYFILNG